MMNRAPFVVLFSSLACVAIVTGCGASFTPPTLISITVVPASPSIAKGFVEQFTAFGTSSDGITQNLTNSVTWTSSTPSVASISSAGLATALAVGSTYISASQGGVSSQADTFAVTAPTLVSIAVTPYSPSVAKGLTEQFAATGTYTDTSTQNITSSVTWISGTPSVATISSAGLATALTVGSTNISASLGTVSSTVDVFTVLTPTLVSIAVTPSAPSVVSGNTQQFTATGTYNDTSTQNITATVTWTSGAPSVATISSAGLATTLTAGSTLITAAGSGGFSGSTTLTVTAPVRNYSGSASVGDFLTISIDPNLGTLTYTNVSNGATGTVSYVVNANGSSTVDDPAGHVLSVSEVPGYGVVMLMNNTGTTADQLALITSIMQQPITGSEIEGLSFNTLSFRTRGGGVAIESVAIDSNGNLSGVNYLPRNLLDGSQNGIQPTGFGPLPSVNLVTGTTQPTPYYLYLPLPEPPASVGKTYIFHAANGMLLIDQEVGSMIGLPKAATPNFNSSWANTYTLTYYQKTNAYGPVTTTPEAGDVSWGVATLTLDGSGNLLLKDSKGNTMASGKLVPVANTPSLYDGVTSSGNYTTGELSDPCYGMFTFTATVNGQTQQVFAAFAGGTVLLSSFSTPVQLYPGNDYNYFYGVALPPATNSSASNAGNSTNQGGSSTANPPGAWNSLAGTVSTTAKRLYVGSSSSGDMLSFTIDPVAGTLAYYDYTTDLNGTATYSWNSTTGASTVSDPNGNVLGALELPNQALWLEIANTTYYTSPEPWVLVMAVPQMNLTANNFEGQSYNFIQMENNAAQDIMIGSVAIGANANLTGNGYNGEVALFTPTSSSIFANLTPLTFPTGTYPQPWVIATNNNLPQSPNAFYPVYLFGYPNSLIFLNTQTVGTLVGVPKNTSAAFQPTVGGNPITGTYQVMFYRRQVQDGSTCVSNPNPCNGGEYGPNGTYKNMTETQGVSMGFATLTVTSAGVATLVDQSNTSFNDWTGTLQPVSSQSSLYNGGSTELTDPCYGLYTMTYSSGSGSSLQTNQIFLGFVPGTQPAVVLSTFSVAPNGSPAPNITYYQYRYGMGFRTGP